MKHGKKMLTTVNLEVPNYNYLKDTAKKNKRSISSMINLIIECHSNLSKSITKSEDVK